jgi:hypothetical protein
MSYKYTTRQGDQWDMIALTQLGDEMLADKLMDANRDKLSIFEFGSGVELTIPDITESDTDLPPWRQEAEDE